MQTFLITITVVSWATLFACVALGTAAVIDRYRHDMRRTTMPLRREDRESGIARRFPVKGSHSSVHTVTLFNSGFWGCDCTGWVLHKSKLEDHSINAPRENHCKHINDTAIPAFRSPANDRGRWPTRPAIGDTAVRAFSRSGEEV